MIQSSTIVFDIKFIKWLLVVKIKLILISPPKKHNKANVQLYFFQMGSFAMITLTWSVLQKNQGSWICPNYTTSRYSWDKVDGLWGQQH